MFKSEMTEWRNIMEQKRKRIFWAITIIGALLMLVMLLLPFASSTDDYKEELNKKPDDVYIEQIDMRNSDAVDISLVEYIKVYSAAIEEGIQEETAMVSIGVIVIFLIFAMFTLIMSLLKKPIAIIVFDVLSLLVFSLVRFDFEDRGVIPSRSYDWGITSYLVYIVGVVIMVGAVGMFIEKRKSKNMQA